MERLKPAASIIIMFATARKTKKGSCQKRPERKEKLEKIVINTVINNILRNDKVVNYIVDRCMVIHEREIDKSPADGLRRELAEAEKARKNILAAIEAGIITASTKDRLVNWRNGAPF